MRLRTRALTLDDVPRLVELESELFGDGAWSRWMLREELTGPARFYVGIELPVTGADDDVPDAARLVAYAGTWTDGIDSQVMTIGVASSYQGLGLGRHLLHTLLEHERGRRTQQLFLEVRVDNERAIRMYEQAGFERLGLRRGYYQPENVDALTMRLALRSS